MRKKTLAITLAAVCAWMMTGCAQTNNTATDTSANVQEAQAPERLTEEYLAWNDPEHTHSAEETVSYPRQRAADRDKEIRQYLRSGNLEQVISLVTDNGNKTMAKNSTLLTYYDRHGRLTPLSASDQERILHGDKNVRKL